MTDYTFSCWGQRELIEELEKRDRAHNWIIAEAWRLLELREDDDAVNWRSYTEHHASDALEQWAPEVVER